MIRLPTSRSGLLSARANAMVVAGIGSALINRSRSRVPWARKPDSCVTRDSKVVVSKVLMGVGCIIEGLRIGFMIERHVPSFHQIRLFLPTPFMLTRRQAHIVRRRFPLPNGAHRGE